MKGALISETDYLTFECLCFSLDDEEGDDEGEDARMHRCIRCVKSRQRDRHILCQCKDLISHHLHMYV